MSKRPWTFRRVAKWTVFCFIALYAVYVIVALCIDTNKGGPFGDFFGALNTLFSGAAMIGVVLTLYYGIEQHKNERISDHFFQLLGSFQQLVSQLQVRDGENDYSGRMMIRQLTAALNSQLAEHDFHLTDNALSDSLTPPLSDTQLLDRFRINRVAAYTKWYNDGGWELGHYFRLLYNIVLYIDNQKDSISFEERYAYIRMLRAHLSFEELLLLALNSLTVTGSNMYTFIEEYDMLQNYWERLQSIGPSTIHATYAGEHLLPLLFPKSAAAFKLSLGKASNQTNASTDRSA